MLIQHLNDDESELAEDATQYRGIGVITRSFAVCRRPGLESI